MIKMHTKVYVAHDIKIEKPVTNFFLLTAVFVHYYFPSQNVVMV